MHQQSLNSFQSKSYYIKLLTNGIHIEHSLPQNLGKLVSAF